MDKKSYAFGMSLAGNIVSSGVHGLDFEDFVAGLRDMMTGNKLKISMEEAGEALEQLYTEIEAEQHERMAEAGKAAKVEGEAFLKENASKEGVVSLQNGLQDKVIHEGSGRKPSATDKVLCHYEGSLPNGMVFDSSYKRGEPASFGLNQVIRGWTEGLQLMAEGSKYELYIPYWLGYGENGSGGAIPPYSALIFTVELIKVL
jgi:FKBP-type peptidyl-prolyl cis-trans isomerase FklB